MPSSQSWNEQTRQGNIIENGNMPDWAFSLIINGASPKISSSYGIATIIINSGSPVIVNNRLSGESTTFTINGGTPTIAFNEIDNVPITVNGGSPIIYNNSMKSDLYLCIEVNNGNPNISSNEINGCTLGISATFGTIERNYIHGTSIGIKIGNGTIKNNTISSAQNIVVNASSKPTIIYNNFEYGNVEGTKNIVLSDGATYDIDAAHNWWATTNEAIISESITDEMDDFSLGAVNFVPYLSEPNPQAMPNPSIGPTSEVTVAPSIFPTQPPTAVPTQTNTSNSTSFDMNLTEIVTLFLLVVIVVLLVFVVVFLRRRK